MVVMSHRLLLVDDDPSVIQALKRALRGRVPWTVLTANSARDALEILGREPVDAIVSDERMPEMLGSELLSRVRDACPRTVRIILTGEASFESAIRAINDAEIYRFLSKPCTTDDLIACVEGGIRARDARESDAAARAATALELGDLEARFEEALASLWMAFQPIVSTSRRQIYGYEALMRSDHPGFRSPLELLAAAERLDGLARLDERVFARVAEASADAPAGANLFVNINPSTLNDPLLFTDENPLAPIAERVVLEVTERSSMDQIPDIDEKLTELRRLGFRIAIDDLGTGYSGLTCLVRFAPEFVKYDKELVEKIQDSPARIHLVRSLEGLCGELRIQSIAEGVELEAERQALAGLGCDLLQGYIFDRPAKGFSAIAVPGRGRPLR
jgi:EAL domain-containing protein (putative c-di-GMP-specific phosphodiesterase class I)